MWAIQKYPLKIFSPCYSLPATGSMVDSSEYMVDGGMVRKKHRVQDSLSTNYYLLATSILGFRV
ncbi:hypothetical protein J7K43_07550 [Candidatus Calescamantes bacterium]|nr:hypothetical protein [Candidatus Calescamantes bacterium]